jgi:hypothetical protein
VERSGGRAADDGVRIGRQERGRRTGTNVENAASVDHNPGPQSVEHPGAERIIQPSAAAFAKDVGAPVGTVQVGRGKQHGSTIEPRTPQSRP